MCVDKCPNFQYGNPSTKLCTFVCPSDYPYKDILRNECSASPVYYSMFYSIFHDDDGKLQILAVIVCIAILFLLILLIIGYLIYQKSKKPSGHMVLPLEEFNPDYHI